MKRVTLLVSDEPDMGAGDDRIRPGDRRGWYGWHCTVETVEDVPEREPLPSPNPWWLTFSEPLPAPTPAQRKSLAALASSLVDLFGYPGDVEITRSAPR